MNLTPDRKRQSRLDLTGFKNGYSIVFCMGCDFQYPPLSGGVPQCPNGCSRPLQIATVTDELRALVDGT